MRAFQWDASRLAVPSQLALPSRHVRHALSRRAFLGSAAGAAVGAGLMPSATALAKKASNASPKPTTNTTNIGGIDFSLVFFGPGVDSSSITDFNGFLGVADVQGTGTATNADGSTETLLFDTDMRFMSGVYVGQDGGVHKGAFGFV
jgi:hypothetical protein